MIAVGYGQMKDWQDSFQMNFIEVDKISYHSFIVHDYSKDTNNNRKGWS